MDIIVLVVLSTVVQTAVLTLTPVIFILSFRSQNKANKEATYQKVPNDYTESIKMLVGKLELGEFQLNWRGRPLQAREPNRVLLRK